MNIELVELYKKVVDHFGSQTLAAEALDLEQPSVWAWINGKSKMSTDTALLVEEKTKGKFKYRDLRPATKRQNKAA